MPKFKWKWDQQYLYSDRPKAKKKKTDTAVKPLEVRSKLTHPTKDSEITVDPRYWAKATKNNSPRII